MPPLERPDLISLEIIDIQVKPRAWPGSTALRAFPSVFANEKLIAMGAQRKSSSCLRWKKWKSRGSTSPRASRRRRRNGLVIVGGDPPVSQPDVYAARSALRRSSWEKGALGARSPPPPVVENYPGITQAGGERLVDSSWIRTRPAVLHNLSGGGRSNGNPSRGTRFSSSQPSAL